MKKQNQELRFNNTYNAGSMTILVTKEKNYFLGVCLEFDLIVKEETAKEAQESIIDYATGWLENVQKNKLPESLLNKPAPKKYWSEYADLLAQNTQRVKSVDTPLAHPAPSINILNCQLPYDSSGFAYAV